MLASDMTTLSDKQVQDQTMSFAQSMYTVTGVDTQTFEFIITMKKFKSLHEFVHYLCCFRSPWLYKNIYEIPFAQWVQLNQVFEFKSNEWHGQQKEFHHWCILNPQFRCNSFEQYYAVIVETLRRVNDKNQDFPWDKINKVPAFGGKMKNPKSKGEEPMVYPTEPGVQMDFNGYDEPIEVDDE
jgi:hypothetical protein